MTILKNFNNLSGSFLKNIAANRQKLSTSNGIPRKSFWGYVAVAFNAVDTDRQLKVGPDRLCAEWVIKNGGAVRTVEAPNVQSKNYNALPAESNHFRVKVVDATGSSIMKIGLDHFKGCNYIDTVIIHKCKHLESDGLEGLLHLKNTLKFLQVSACDNISDEGLMVIGELSNLASLNIFDMNYVKNLENVKRNLMKKLPNCHMDIK